MKSQVEQSLIYLKENTKNPYSLNQIIEWLNQNENLFNEVSCYQSELCEQCKEDEEIGLPFDCLITGNNLDNCKRIKFNEFTYTYAQFKKLIEIHNKFELVCKQANEELGIIQEDKLQLKDWLKKYFELGAEHLFMFHIDYLDSGTIEDKNKSLYVINSNFTGFDLFVNRCEFSNIIRFIDSFDELFFNQKLYHEKSNYPFQIPGF